ncbi:hypothetical protein C6341_g9590 [Phytophthora cactorum]|nr:hypothetical protein C6341_g9590 [Phytophthora cactorum]
MAKSSLFELEIKWCGRLISREGVRHDPARVSALASLPLPATVANLQYFVCATNWLHDSLPDYARAIAPLQDKLNAERKRLGRRNRNALNVAMTWSTAERSAYDAVLSLVRDSALMASPDPDAERLVFRDASLTGYSIVVTQVANWDPTIPVTKQRYEMIICKGGMFKHNVEKEAYPIVKACQDLEYLLLRPKGFQLYCDHANLVYIFAPHDALKKHVRDRLQRWAMRLCGLHYVIKHIAGEDNLWGDIVSRWHTHEVVRVTAVQTRSRHVAPLASISRLRPLSDDEFVFPTLVTFARRNRWLCKNVPACESLWKRWMDHRGQVLMSTLLQQRFWITRVNEKVAKFIRECLLCKHVKGPRIIPRPYGPTHNATKRNEALHWDFLSLGSGYGDTAYLLVAKDELAHYCSESQSPLYQTKAVMCARMKIEQEFSPVYSPWINGTVERLNKDILQVLRVLLLEYDLDFHDFAQLDAVIGRRDDVDFVRAIDLDEVDEQAETLRRSLHGMHKKVQDEKERRRVQDVAAHKGSIANIDVGDFVLWSRIDQRLPDNKLLGQWVGPFKVIEAKPHSFVIQHLISGREYDVHASRLKFYADSELNQTAELLELVSRQGMVLGVEEFRNHRFNDALDRWELQVSWMGLQAIEDSWEPLDVLAQDVPVKVRDYINASGDDDLRAQLE